MNMRSCLLAVALAASTLPARADAPNYEIAFTAMQDELERSMSELVMEDLSRPYFISYTLDDFQNLRIRSVLGTIVSSQLDRDRFITVDLRVGDSIVDNSNFVAGFFSMRPAFRKVALGDDYDALRHELYLETDDVYKQALKVLSRKQATLQNRHDDDRPADFLVPAPNRYLDQPEAFDLEAAPFEAWLRSGSAVLRQYPAILSSRLDFEVLVANQCLVNSVGSRTLRGDRTYVLRLSLYGQCPDGADVWAADDRVARQRDELPGNDELVAWIRTQADALVARLAAETVEEYAGPVLFEGDAAGAFLRQLFARNITGCPAPTYENDNAGRRGAGREFENRIKRRVLPEFMDVYDDPTIDRLGPLRLMGRVDVDDAGQTPRRIQVVEDGRLVTLPIGTAPTKKVTATNGHARGGVSKPVDAKPTNLVFESGSRVSETRLKQELLDLCRDFDLEYGIVIRTLDDLYAQRGRDRIVFAGGGSSGNLTAPMAAFKVYPDGREEPVRHLEFNNVTTRLLRDIIKTGDRSHAYHYLIGDDPEMPASIVAPALLVEEMELTKVTASVEKPPVLPSPLADR